MKRKTSPARLLRIGLSRNVGGRLLPAMLQLVLIFMWHVMMIVLVETIPFDDLWVWASNLWYQAGITSSYISDMESFGLLHEGGIAALSATMRATIILVLLEILLGWIGYRVLVRRPRPRWNRFVRFWWRTCLIGTFMVLMVMSVPPLLPVSPGNPLELLGPAALGVFFCVGPGWFARREADRRARRIGQICPVCSYCLRGITADVCPECGTPLVPDPRGGHAVDRERLRLIVRRQGGR